MVFPDTMIIKGTTMALYDQLTAKHFEVIIKSSLTKQLWSLAKQLDGVLYGCHLEIDAVAYGTFLKAFEVKGMENICSEAWADTEVAGHLLIKEDEVLGIVLYFHQLHMLCFQWLKPKASDFANGFFDRAPAPVGVTNTFFHVPQLMSPRVKKDSLTLDYTEKLYGFIRRLFETPIMVSDAETCAKLRPSPDCVEDTINVSTQIEARGSKDSPIFVTGKQVETLTLLGGISRLKIKDDLYHVSRYDKDLLEKLINPPKD